VLVRVIDLYDTCRTAYSVHCTSTFHCNFSIRLKQPSSLGHCYSTLWNPGIQKLQSWQIQTKVCMAWREKDGCGEAGTKPRWRATKTSFSVRDTQTDSLTQSAVMQIIHHNLEFHMYEKMLCSRTEWSKPPCKTRPLEATAEKPVNCRPKATKLKSKKPTTRDASKSKAENFVKTVQTSHPWEANLWPKIEICTVFGAVFLHFYPDKREIWHGGAARRSAPPCQISHLSSKTIPAWLPFAQAMLVTV